MGFVIAAGLNRLGLLRDLHSTMDSLDGNVKDAPGTPSTATTTTKSASELPKRGLQTSPPPTDPTITAIATTDRPTTSASQDKEQEEQNEQKAKGTSGEEEKEEKKEQKKEGTVETEEKKDEDVLECKKKKKTPNIALFYADDWTMKVLGKFDKHVKTPNIDAMADNGMIFTNNCVTTSVCWSSRSTLSTGTYAAIHKHTMPFEEAKFETDVWPETLYPLMKKGLSSGACQNGYYTGLVGKWHKMEVQKELNAAFDQRIIYYGNHYEERDGRMQHVTELNKIDSIQFLNNWQHRFETISEEERRPFFLTTSFFATHARDGMFPSYQPQNSTRSRFYPDFIDIPTPKTATSEHWNQLPDFLMNGEARTRWKNRFEPKDFQSNIKDMYAMATQVDEAVGAIIDKIQSLGVYDETVLIFTTDNGNMHGEHGLAEKWYPFEESMRVPLVIQDPRMPKERRGTMSDAWTLNVDLAPTILGIANIPPSKFMQGRDISDLYRNVDFPDQATLSIDEKKEKVGWRKDWFYEFNLGASNDGEDHPWQYYIDAAFALVTDEWKYVYWPQHKYEQLFHRSVDPYDEFDLLDKVLRPNKQGYWKKPISVADDEKTQLQPQTENGCCDTIQTTLKMHTEMKKRYAVLKEQAQNGERI
jgi:arylsulfatase A-like enzyme